MSTVTIALNACAACKRKGATRREDMVETVNLRSVNAVCFVTAWRKADIRERRESRMKNDWKEEASLKKEQVMDKVGHVKNKEFG